jgi:hypothetical protein
MIAQSVGCSTCAMPFWPYPVSSITSRGDEDSVQSSSSARPIERRGLCTLRPRFYAAFSGASSLKKTLIGCCNPT